MDREPSIVLLGMRGCGKSSVGARVASSLGLRFVDLDREILSRSGFASVREFWEARGQDAFRAGETQTLREILDLARAHEERVVLALGGGAPTAPGARELLDARRTVHEAFVVYLRCSIGTLRERLRETLALDPNRPSVTGADPVRELDDLLRARDPVYRACADAVVDADDGDVESVAERVIQAASR